MQSEKGFITSAVLLAWYEKVKIEDTWCIGYRFLELVVPVT